VRRLKTNGVEHSLTYNRLNVLARQLDEQRLKISGTTTFNDSHKLNVRYGYVVQHDLLIPTLTVRETLQYAADLRLREAISDKERKDAVEQTILELSLKECAATRVGTSNAKGCSGGNRS
jgi:ABC-type multidrug transport system ATPase subunit